MKKEIQIFILFLLCCTFRGWGQPEDHWQGFPLSLKERYQEIIKLAQEMKYLPKKEYTALLTRLDTPMNLEQARTFLQDLTQFAFDHDTANTWVISLSEELQLPEMKAIGNRGFPSTIFLDQIQFSDSSILVGTGGPLTRRWPDLEPKSLTGQRYIEPNLGIEGISNWWIIKEDIAKYRRIKHPFPKAFLKRTFQMDFDTKGRLLVDGVWVYPGKGEKNATIHLTPSIITEGLTLFVNKEMGIQTLQPTYLYPQLGEVKEFSKEAKEGLGWIPPTYPEIATSSIAIDTLKKQISPLLKGKKITIDWPAPFNPVEEKTKWVLQQKGLIDKNKELSLLRMRAALIYGKELPDLAVSNPKKFLKLEKALLEAFKTGNTKKVIKLKPSPKELLAMIPNVAHFEKPPTTMTIENAFVRFPVQYSPWRKFPLVIALHGQYCEPKYDFGLWSKHCDSAGFILACPRFGSRKGAPRNQEDDQKVLKIVHHLSLHYNVDPNRIYLTGISMGGAKSWSLASTYTERWAAVAPEIHGPIWKVRVRSKEGFKLRWLLLKNLSQLPLSIFEGKFDGLNTYFSRQAVKKLKEYNAPVNYFEAGLFGHERMAWRYPLVLQWFLNQKRKTNVTEISLNAIHSWSAQYRWIAIRKISGSAAWTRNDGAFSISDLVGINVKYQDNLISIEKEVGKPREIEVFYDSTIMKDGPITIQWSTGSKKWKPRFSTRKLLKRVLETGDRGQLYSDSYKITLR